MDIKLIIFARKNVFSPFCLAPKILCEIFPRVYFWESTAEISVSLFRFLVWEFIPEYNRELLKKKNL